MAEIDPARLHRDYRIAFLRYLPRRDEAALTSAYELGRAAMASGTSVLTLVQAHHAVLSEVVATSPAEQHADVIAAAGELLCEVLAVSDLEITLRHTAD